MFCTSTAAEFHTYLQILSLCRIQMKRTGKEATIDVRCPGKEARLITSIAMGDSVDNSADNLECENVFKF